MYSDARTPDAVSFLPPIWVTCVRSLLAIVLLCCPRFCLSPLLLVLGYCCPNPPSALPIHPQRERGAICRADKMKRISFHSPFLALSFPLGGGGGVVSLWLNLPQPKTTRSCGLRGRGERRMLARTSHSQNSISFLEWKHAYRATRKLAASSYLFFTHVISLENFSLRVYPSFNLLGY